MDLNYSKPALEHALATARTVETLEKAFAEATTLTPEVGLPENFGHKLFCPGLDAVVPRLARVLQLTAEPPAKSNERVCIIATHYYSSGGHSRVASDIAKRLAPESPVVAILTDLYERDMRYQMLLNQPQLRSSLLDEQAFLVLSAGSLVEKTVELHMMLRAIRPTRIVLMVHPFDLVAVVATWAFRDIVEFVHHADHIPALGATLPYSAHIDLTYTCHQACLGHGLDARYIGMSSPVMEAPPRRRDPHRLRLATCGGPRKFTGPGRYTWTDFAVAAMRQPGAEMTHIGFATETFQQELHAALAAEGLDPGKYQFVGQQPNLPAELIAREIDVFLSSYPVDGGKTNLEAMLADVPVVIPVLDDMPPLLRFSLPLPRYVEINRLEDLGVAIERALELGVRFTEPEQVRLRDEEIARFHAYVDGEPATASRAADQDQL